MTLENSNDNDDIRESEAHHFGGLFALAAAVCGVLPYLTMGKSAYRVV
ncbi:hypothetical protein ACFOGG_13040 [Brenneria rubrifaciens]